MKRSRRPASNLLAALLLAVAGLGTMPVAHAQAPAGSSAEARRIEIDLA